MDDGIGFFAEGIEEADGVGIEGDGESFVVVCPIDTMRIFGPADAAVDGVEHVDTAAHFDVPNEDGSAAFVIVADPASGGEIPTIGADGKGDDFGKMTLRMDEPRAQLLQDTDGVRMQIAHAERFFSGEQLAAYVGQAFG